MKTWEGSCACGQLRATSTGEPMRVSICHCLDCKRRSGSAFAWQARWPDDQVEFRGDYREWTKENEGGSHATFRFCPSCGSTVAYTLDSMPGLTAIPVGAFADPAFPPPDYSVYEGRKPEWLTIAGDDIEHWD